jgi:hypothetical protein
MRLATALVCGLLGGAGCGAGPEAASASMGLTTSGLSESDIAAIEVLVLDGDGASCTRALRGGSPLDDPGLELVAHALFTVDGTAKHLSIPAGRRLVFYAEAFASAGVGPGAPGRTRIGRGCVEQSLAAGASSGVMITISANE